MGVGLGEAGGADWGRGEPPDSMQQTLYLYNKKKIANLGILPGGCNEKGNWK